MKSVVLHMFATGLNLASEHSWHGIGICARTELEWGKYLALLCNGFGKRDSCMPLLSISRVSPCLLQTDLEMGSLPMPYIFVVLLAAASYAINGDDLAVLIKGCLLYKREPSFRRTTEEETEM